MCQLHAWWLHCHWNHWSLNTAAHPQLPEASEYNLTVLFSTSGSMPIPFHCSKNLCHQRRSDIISWLNRTRWFLFLTFAISSIILRTKRRPGFTTVDACWSSPTNELMSFLRPESFPSHSWTDSFTLWSLSAGNRNSMLTESISIPRNLRHVDGPSHLWGANGTPSCSQVCHWPNTHQLQGPPQWWSRLGNDEASSPLWPSRSTPGHPLQQ